MSEIAKCRMCGAEAKCVYGKYWACSDNNCACYGPYNDPDGAKWNALMRRTPTEPRAGTVRVPKSMCHMDDDELIVLANDGTLWRGYWSERKFVWHADIPPLPQPTEIPGAVEVGDE